MPYYTAAQKNANRTQVDGRLVLVLKVKVRYLI